MQKQRTRTAVVNPDEADRGSQAGVLAHLLYLHPAQLTVEEIVREFANDPDDFEQRDQVERAVDDLVRAGLLHRNGKFAVPALPAVRFDGLELGDRV
ncbi:MAG TPA: hypothetical protein VHF90_04080 [Thermoleophilaceae bacterium]|nr:hypothetical protein [Thermoleophilaceae bacterium]